MPAGKVVFARFQTALGTVHDHKDPERQRVAQHPLLGEKVRQRTEARALRHDDPARLGERAGRVELLPGPECEPGGCRRQQCQEDADKPTAAHRGSGRAGEDQRGIGAAEPEGI